MSGYLVARYLPEHGHQDGRTLWLIIALLTMYVSVCMRMFVPDVEVGRGNTPLSCISTQFSICHLLPLPSYHLSSSFICLSCAILPHSAFDHPSIILVTRILLTLTNTVDS